MRKAFSFFAAAVVMLVSAKASAAFHVMKVVEVYAGPAGAPNASYVQLQMYAAGQNFVNTHSIQVFDAAGAEIAASKVTFGADVANGADQATILVGTAAVMPTFGVAPDFTLPANFVQAGGAVCFDNIDCFTWGTFAGTAADGSGTPFAALSTGMAAKRKLTAGASATLLEEADDTGSSAADFVAGAPSPRNNNGVMGGLDGGTTVVDSGVADSGVQPGVDSGTKDSGVSTVPTPGGQAGTVRADSGSDPAAPPAEEDSGCNQSSRSSEGWSATLGLAAAAAMFLVSRRRRAKR